MYGLIDLYRFKNVCIYLNLLMTNREAVDSLPIQ